MAVSLLPLPGRTTGPVRCLVMMCGRCVVARSLSSSLASCPIPFASSTKVAATATPSQPGPVPGAGWLSPLCSPSPSGRRRSFGGRSRDTAQRAHCTADKPRSRPAVHLTGVWRRSCPCCAARRLPSAPSVPNAGSPDRAAASAWTCLCRGTRGSWACTAGRPAGCRWWRTWRRRPPGRRRLAGPALRLRELPTWPRQRRGSRQRGSRCTLPLTAVGREHSLMFNQHSAPCEASGLPTGKSNTLVNSRSKDLHDALDRKVMLWQSVLDITCL